MSGILIVITIIAAIVSTILEIFFKTHWLIIVISDLVYLVEIMLLAELRSNTKKIKYLENLLIDKKIIEEQSDAEHDIVERAELLEQNVEGASNLDTAIQFCSKCNYQLFPEDTVCPNCQTPRTSGNKQSTECVSLKTNKKAANVYISCPVWPGQLFNNDCIAYNDDTDEELARCKQGETLIFELSEFTAIRVVVKGSFGQPTKIMQPGDKYKIGYRGFGKIYLAKVDVIL